MGVVDVGVFLIFFISVITATYRGLVRELLSIASLILATLAGIYGCSLVHPLLAVWIENPDLASVASTGLIIVVILIIMHVINLKICRELHTTCLSTLDKTLGGIFGFLRALIIICAVYLAFSLVLSEPEMIYLKHRNFSMPYIKKTTDAFTQMLPTETQKMLNEFAAQAQKDKIGTQMQEKKEMDKRAPRARFKIKKEE